MRAFLTLCAGALMCILLLNRCTEETAMSPCVRGDGSFRYQIDENSPAGALVGKIEVESAEQMRFYIYSGNTNNTFNINLFDGRIFVKDNALLDFERNREFELLVMAKSPFCNTSLVTITIQVSDLKE